MLNKTLIQEALTSQDRAAFFAAHDEEAETLDRIWNVAHITIKEIRQYTGLTQAAFAESFFIPKRSIENWEGGTRDCPPYVRLMLAQITGAAEWM